MGLTNLIGKYRTVNVIESTDDGGWKQSVELRPKDGVELADIVGSVSRRAKYLEAKGRSPDSVFIKYNGEDRVPLTELIPDYESRAEVPRTLAGDISAELEGIITYTGLVTSLIGGGALLILHGIMNDDYSLDSGNSPMLVGSHMLVSGLFLCLPYLCYILDD